MAKLTKAEVLHVAKLSNLKLTDDEVEKYLSQLGRVIEHISELSEVDTKRIEPTSQSTGLTDITRPDEIKPGVSMTQEQAVSGTDKTYNGYFKVGAILSERTDK